MLAGVADPGARGSSAATAVGGFATGSGGRGGDDDGDRGERTGAVVRLSMSERELPSSAPGWLVLHIPFGTVWAEEAAFRAALATAGTQAFGPVGGRLLQAGAFGLSHIADARATGAPAVPTVLVTGLAGWVFGWLAERSGSLAAPILTHLAINEAGAVAALAVQRRQASAAGTLARRYT